MSFWMSIKSTDNNMLFLTYGFIDTAHAAEKKGKILASQTFNQSFLSIL